MTYHQENIPYIPQQVFLPTKDWKITIFDCWFTIKWDTITSHQSHPLDNVRLVNKHALLVWSNLQYQIMTSGVLTNCMPCGEIDINIFLQDFFARIQFFDHRGKTTTIDLPENTSRYIINQHTYTSEALCKTSQIFKLEINSPYKHRKLIQAWMEHNKQENNDQIGEC